MIGMSFISFVILLIISVAVSAVLHYGLKCYVTPGGVVLPEGGSGVGGCVARIAGLRLLA